jgi:CBS domain-containing protein
MLTTIGAEEGSMEPQPHGDLIAMPVAEIMSRPVFTVADDAVLVDVLAAMVRTGRRHMAVVDARGHCLGVVGDRAVAAAWAANPAAMDFVAVRRLLDERPSVVGIDANVHDVARGMYIDRVDAVAVIDREGKPVGMITGGDLIALMARAVPTESDGIPPAEAQPGPVPVED